MDKAGGEYQEEYGRSRVREWGGHVANRKDLVGSVALIR